MRKIWKLALLIGISLILGLVYLEYPYRPDEFSDLLYGTWLSITAIAVLYLLFRFIIEPIGAKNFKDPKAVYSFRKAVSILLIITCAMAILVIWIDETPILLVSFGLVAAAIAVSLQDIFKNFVGGLIIFSTGLYGVGDRVDIGGKLGDVVDVGIMYTTMMEIKGWLEGEQVTGRLTTVPNGHVLNTAVNNYTKDFSFVWDELLLPITYESDWKGAIEVMMTVATSFSGEQSKLADQQLETISGKYYITKTMVEPIAYMKMTDNWVEVAVRYIVSPRERRSTKSKMSHIISGEFERRGIRVASQTVEIVGLPEVRMRAEDKGL
jgi:small-conductance mechanosensitive channel